MKRLLEQSYRAAEEIKQLLGGRGGARLAFEQPFCS
jgi:hypothetical protein